MTKKPIQKLLAVITFVSAASTSAIAAPRTLANGAPAPGNTVAKGETYSAKESPKERAQNELAAARAALSSVLMEERAAVRAIVERPRVLASGAPACGNANSKPLPTGACDEAAADQYVTMRLQRVIRAGARVATTRTRLAVAEKVYAKYASPSTTAASPPPAVPPLAIAMEVAP
ncbi:MAG: hypothetical protein ACKV2T_26215 [Kofleriaceae bacterium]